MKKLLAILIISMSICSVAAQDTLEDYDIKIGDLYIENKHKEALELANIAISKYPNAPELYYARGLAQQELGNKKAALADLDKAIQMNYKDDGIYFARGLVKLDMNNLVSAQKDFTTCIQINPKNYSCYYERAQLRLLLGDIFGYKSDKEKFNKYIEEERKSINQ